MNPIKLFWGTVASDDLNIKLIIATVPISNYIKLLL